MSTEKPTAEESAKNAIEAKVKELSETYGKVTPISVKDDDGVLITGYFKQPTYDLILFCTDCTANKEMTKGGEAMVRGCIIREASDNRIEDKENNPVIAASFALAAIRLMKLLSSQSNEIKKK